MTDTSLTWLIKYVNSDHYTPPHKSSLISALVTLGLKSAGDEKEAAAGLHWHIVKVKEKTIRTVDVTASMF